MFDAFARAREQGVTLTFSITGVDGDTPDDYANLSTGNAAQGNSFFAAHVAGDILYFFHEKTGTHSVPLLAADFADPAAFLLMIVPAMIAIHLAARNGPRRHGDAETR